MPPGEPGERPRTFSRVLVVYARLILRAGMTTWPRAAPNDLVRYARDEDEPRE